MLEIDYPTIHLFLYNLQDGLGRNEDDIRKTHRQFWECIYPNIDSNSLDNLRKIEFQFDTEVLLLKQNKNNIEIFSDSLDGYYCPSKIDDSYSLQANCSGRLNDPSWDSLSWPQKLHKIKDYIDLQIDCSGKRSREGWKNLPLEEKVQQIKSNGSHDHQAVPGSLGANWLVWGQLTSTPSNEDTEKAELLYEKTAKACYESSNIVPKPNWEQDLKGKGIYRETMLFELEQRDYTPDGKNNNYYVLICLLPENVKRTDITRTLIGELNRLFFYRNKVLWAYEKSRQSKDSLRRMSVNISDLIKSLITQTSDSVPNYKLRKLQDILGEALRVSYRYETYLVYLKEQVSTISINIKNYDKRFQMLSSSARDSDDLEFLKKFTSYSRQKHLTQARTDHESLSIGLQPFGNFIKAIEGITEIEKAKNEQVSNKNERTFNKIIAVASVGISTASLAAIAIGEQADGIVKSIFPVQANQSTPAINLWMNFGLIFFLSIAIGAISALVTNFIIDKLSHD